MQVNHFPIRRSLSFCRSVSKHPRPDRYAAFLRNPSQAFDAAVEDSKVVVYHAAVREPEDRQRLVEQRTLSADLDAQSFLRAVNAHVGFALRSSGFLRIRGPARHEFISPDKHLVVLVTEVQGASSPRVPGRAHLRWTWDVERHHGRTWLVPVAGRCFLSATSPLGCVDNSGVILAVWATAIAP